MIIISLSVVNPFTTEFPRLKSDATAGINWIKITVMSPHRTFFNIAVEKKFVPHGMKNRCGINLADFIQFKRDNPLSQSHHIQIWRHCSCHSLK